MTDHTHKIVSDFLIGQSGGVSTDFMFDALNTPPVMDELFKNKKTASLPGPDVVPVNKLGRGLCASDAPAHEYGAGGDAP